ncbi:MAG: DUF2927 domain-containing protein [Pseudolabrys sp.]|nr:DUF2927 domain-containing protein [Pseudolabrys sp.]
MKRVSAAFVILMLTAPLAVAASGKQAAPAGSLKGAPHQYTRFTAAELQRGFLALAFGSDLRIGAPPRGIRRFDRPIHLHIIAGGSVARGPAMARIAEEYAGKVPNLHLSVVAGPAPAAASADIEVRLIDEKDFNAALRVAFGAKVARTFIRRTNPQCMTSVKSGADGAIVRSVVFIIVDKGDDVFRDCAYHELLHAFGLSNHDQRNPWTTLNQKRMVGYLTVYDRALLTLLYDPHMTPGMTRRQVRTALPGVIGRLGLATTPRAR